MGKKIIYQCDVCKSESESQSDVAPRTVPVVFTTEQTEGNSTKPYMVSSTIDLCDSCYERIKDTQPLMASGAQGWNNYYWRKAE